MSIEILQGDCVELLNKIEDQSINTCITSPPYWGLRDYGVDGQLGLEETAEEFIEGMVRVFSEVKRVLRDDGTLWLNMGDSYAMTSIRGKDSKFSGHLGSMKHWGKEGSIQLGKRNLPFNLKPKNLIGMPWRLALALQADGWYLRQDIIWHKPNPMPESVRDRCTKSHEYIFLLSKKPKYYYDHEAIKENSVRAGSIPKGKKYSSELADNKIGGKHTRETLNEKPVAAKKNKRSVWKVSTKPFKGAHFATFPKDLIEPCVLAGCPESGTVLDPFGGSGTTGIVAAQHNRNAVLLELNQEYIDLAKERIKKEVDND
jgi:site-specific DNA-methyltransferase (adenine-specific)